jgi:hypothetical protein
VGCWNEAAVAFWSELWASPVSLAIDPAADGPELRRWLQCVHDREQLLDEVRRQGWTLPSRGGRVANPGLRHVHHLDRELGRFAEQFGGTPLSRFRLQLTYAEAGQADDRLQRLLDRRADKRPGQSSRAVVARAVEL